MNKELLDDISSLEDKAVSEIESASSLQDLEKVRLSYLGKRGVIKAYFDNLKEIEDAGKKRNLGEVINVLRNKLDQLIMNKENILKAKEVNFKLQNEAIDITLPVRPEKMGKVHPLSKVINEVKLIFAHMGFKAVDGPDIEDEFHVFDGRCCCDSENERTRDKGQWRKGFQESVRVEQIETRKKHGDNRYHGKREENSSSSVASFLASANVSFVLSIATTSNLFHRLLRRFTLLLLLDSLSSSIPLQCVKTSSRTPWSPFIYGNKLIASAG